MGMPTPAVIEGSKVGLPTPAVIEGSKVGLPTPAVIRGKQGGTTHTCSDIDMKFKHFQIRFDFYIALHYVGVPLRFYMGTHVLL